MFLVWKIGIADMLRCAVGRLVILINIAVNTNKWKNYTMVTQALE